MRELFEYLILVHPHNAELISNRVGPVFTSNEDDVHKCYAIIHAVFGRGLVGLGLPKCLHLFSADGANLAMERHSLFWSKFPQYRPIAQLDLYGYLVVDYSAPREVVFLRISNGDQATVAPNLHCMFAGINSWLRSGDLNDRLYRLDLSEFQRCYRSAVGSIYNFPIE